MEIHIGPAPRREPGGGPSVPPVRRGCHAFSISEQSRMSGTGTKVGAEIRVAAGGVLVRMWMVWWDCRRCESVWVRAPQPASRRPSSLVSSRASRSRTPAASELRPPPNTSRTQPSNRLTDPPCAASTVKATQMSRLPSSKSGGRESRTRRPQCRPRAHRSVDRTTRRGRWCRRPDSNRRPKDFQSFALPTELPRHLVSGRNGADDGT